MTTADGRWWERIFREGGIPAAEHIHLAEEALARAEQTRIANSGETKKETREAVRETLAAADRRATAHALIAITLNTRP